MKTKMECFHNIFLDEYKSKNDKTSKIWKNILYFLILIQILFQILFHCQNDKQSESKQNERGPNNVKFHKYLPFFYDHGFVFGVCFGCESENTDQQRSYLDKNINIARCFFSRTTTFSGNGGVICINGGSYSMMINYSVFFNCFALNGGAIYFSSSDSYIRMICANRCSASNYAHFAYIIAFHENLVEYLSESNCSYTTSGYWSIRLESGEQRVDYTNNSMNNAQYYSGIVITTPSLFTSSHCTFSNNKVSHYVCIYFHTTSGTISISFANIVKNNSPLNYGVILVWGAGQER